MRFEKGITREKAEETILADAKKINYLDIITVLQKSKEIKKKFEKAKALKIFITESNLMIDLVQDFFSGKYRTVSFWPLSLIIAALLYVLNPFDLIPDAIPIFGYDDDSAIVALCLEMVENDIQEYKTWKADNPFIK
jgi:uncharacterized membrane protein YkvA (DUF1232 family)